MKKFFVWSSVVLCSVSSSLHAEMVFEKKLVEIHCSPNDKEVVGEFPFVIKGEDETIKDYDAKCVCLAARVEPLNPDRSAKLRWKVGESGKMMAKFDVTKFLGTVDKAIELNLVGDSEPIVLTVRVHVPELVSLSPTNLKWDLGGPAEPKTIKIKVQHKEPIRILEHRGNNPRFKYEFKTIKEGWEYEVVVTPSDTSSSGLGMLSFTTDCKFPRFKRAMGYAVIRPKRDAGGVSKP
ncbi:MAG: hypothetical protein ACON38_08585 [Akkermansiaceae bacterium]